VITQANVTGQKAFAADAPKARRVPEACKALGINFDAVLSAGVPAGSLGFGVVRGRRGLSPFQGEPVDLCFGNEGSAGYAHEPDFALRCEPVE
jgi:hypothetical protein